MSPAGACVIVGAGEFDGLRSEHKSEFVIAVDGGYDSLRKINVTPKLIVGDCDSIKAVPDNIEAVCYPAEKNQSDLELAVGEAIKRGFRSFYIYGALGKRLDHSLASMAVLIGISQKGLNARLIGTVSTLCEATAITNSRLVFEAGSSGTISIFPAGEKAEGVYLQGLKYQLDNAVLHCHETVGLSNEFTGEEAVIEVKSGTLIIILQNM